MTPAQVRAARQLLGWSSLRLSALCCLPSNTVEIFERTGHMPNPISSAPQIDRLALIQNVLEAAGIAFIDGDASDTQAKLESKDQ